ncbi:MAG: ArsR/SmtB family transcription factor [Phycisphaerales bacterium JB038]
MLSDTDKKRYQSQADVVQSLAHPLRLALVDHLQHGDCCVQDLADHLGAERSNVSRHLSILLHSGIVQSRKQGVQVFYSLRTPCILNFLTCATSVIRQSVEDQAQLL